MGASGTAEPAIPPPPTFCAVLPLSFQIAVAGPWKQKRPRRAAWKSLVFLRKSGAGEGIRTLDPNLGKIRSEASVPFGASCAHPVGAPDTLTPLTVSVASASVWP